MLKWTCELGKVMVHYLTKSNSCKTFNFGVVFMINVSSIDFWYAACFAAKIIAAQRSSKKKPS